MRNARQLLVVIAIGLIFGAGSRASAQIHAEPVITGLTRPVAFVQDPSQPNVQIIAEQGGRLWIVQDGHVIETPFLDISDQVSPSGDGGLLGFTFAPDYATSRRFYLNFTDLNNNTVIARFTRSETDPFAADPASRFDLMWPDGNRFITQPGGGHNGGNLAFGPDGMLWIALGDGGGGGDGDLPNSAQNPATLLGKMLRIDVSVPDDDPAGYVVPGNNPYVGQDGVLAEIWDFGFRNPWRYSFDDPARGGTGALILADVGENQWEELDYEAPGSPGGVNYGWSLREGAHDFNPDQAGVVGAHRPVLSSTGTTTARALPAASSIAAPRSGPRTTGATSSVISSTDGCGRCGSRTIRTPARQGPRASSNTPARSATRRSCS